MDRPFRRPGGEIQMNPTTSKLATLLGTASLLTMANAMAAQAQQVAQAQMAQAGPAEVPEQVLITGSLIHGAVAVGVPVTNLSPAGFRPDRRPDHRRPVQNDSGRQRVPGPVAVQSGANIERATRVNLRQLDTGNRHPFAADGRRHPRSRARATAPAKSTPRSFPRSRWTASTSCSTARRRPMVRTPSPA